MKKLIAFVLILCMFVCVTASCSDSGSTSEDVIDRTPTETIIADAKDAVSGEDLYLVRSGDSKYRIILAENSTSTEGYAANYLKKIISDVTGRELDIVKDTSLPETDVNNYYISVGKTAVARVNDIAADRATFGGDGFLLTKKGNTVFILGGSDMGTLYGVQEFLSYTLNYEAYYYNAVYYDKTPDVRMKELNDIKEIPDIAGRMGIVGTYVDLASHAVMRCRSNLKYCGSMDGEEWISSALCYHSIENIEGIKEHKEWFNNGQLCHSNEDAIAYVAEKTAAIIKATPETTIYFELGNADHKTNCLCDECAAAAKENGGYGGLYVIWLNKVAKAVEDIFAAENYTRKEWYVTGLMYDNYKDAPVIENAEGEYVPVNENVVCTEHVGVRYAPIDACYAHGLTDDNCKINREEGYKKSFLGWGKLTDNYLLWTYEVEFGNFFAFFDDYGSLASNIRSFADAGVKVWFSQVGQNSNNPFSALRVYLSSELGWNKDADADVLIKKFFNGYYAEAAPYMTEYFNLLRANKSRIDVALNNDGHLVYATQTGNYMSAEYWSFSFLKKLSSIVEKAYEAIENANYTAEEGENMRLRIRAEEMFISALLLKNYASASYMTPTEMLKLKESFIRDNELLGNTRYNENDML